MDFPAEWGRCSPWIQAALDEGFGTHTIDDVRCEIETADAHFWPGKRAALVTEFINYPRCKALNFWLLGGNGRELLKHIRPAAEAWGRAQGCTLFLGLGSPDRPSWGRALKRHGYRAGWSAYVKDTR